MIAGSLGGPGSGKTTLLLELARRMFDRAEADETQPISVVFHLASWAPSRASLAAWLVDELNTRYDVPRAIGAAWVGAALAFGLIDGLSGKAIETRTRPNQGIRRSVRTALRVGGAVWLCVGLLLALAAGLSDVQVAGLADRSLFGLLFGLVAGLFFGLMYGGIAGFQHVLLRLILWRGGTIPWRYADFLDYCAGYLLLYRVGGGYLFVHRLLEYFASLDTPRL